MRATVGFVLFSIFVIGALKEHNYLPRPQVLERLASQADIGDKFQDPARDWFEARAFLSILLLLAPVATLGAGLALVAAKTLLESTITPIGRVVGLADGMTLGLVAVLAAGVAYTKADLWVPWTLRMLGLIARAYLVSTA